MTKVNTNIKLLSRLNQTASAVLQFILLLHNTLTHVHYEDDDDDEDEEKDEKDINDDKSNDYMKIKKFKKISLFIKRKE